MKILQRITPSNLAQAREAFLANPTKNPQFMYEDPVDSQDLAYYGTPNKQLSELAQMIASKAYFHRNDADLDAMDGALCTQTQVKTTAAKFLRLHHLEKRYEVVFSHSFVSRASITTTKLKFRLPIEHRRESLVGTLYHEVGTHALRRVNYEKQPWFKKKKAHGFRPYLETEEGLASLHARLPRSFRLAHAAALRYLVVSWSQEGSFIEVWQKLGKYIQDPNRRWNIVLRQKRGMTDTSVPGGFTKDIVYLSGMVDIWRWLAKQSFDPTDLYWGKLHHLDVPKARKLNPYFQPKLPIFYQSSPDTYATEIDKIGKINFFPQLQ